MPVGTVLFTAEEIARRVAEVGGQIARDYAGQPLTHDLAIRRVANATFVESNRTIGIVESTKMATAPAGGQE